jgi:hypothetical protein
MEQVREECVCRSDAGASGSGPACGNRQCPARDCELHVFESKPREPLAMPRPDRDALLLNPGHDSRRAARASGRRGRRAAAAAAAAAAAGTLLHFCRCSDRARSEAARSAARRGVQSVFATEKCLNDARNIDIGRYLFSPTRRRVGPTKGGGEYLYCAVLQCWRSTSADGIHSKHP